MKAFAVFFLSCLLMYACKDASENDDVTLEHIVINIEASTDTVDISSLVRSVDHIVLETSDSCVLRRVRKIVIHKQSLYILDDVVYVFDFRGNLVRKIGKIGRGPGELLKGDDFVVDVRNGNVEIFEFNRGLLHEYTGSGDFLSSQSFPFGYINRFEKRNNGDYVVWKCLTNISEDESGFLGYKIYVGNFEEGFSHHRPCYEYDGNMRLSQSFSQNADAIYFWEILADTIFEINAQDEYVPRFYIDFGKQSMPESIRKIPLEDRVFSLRDNFTMAGAIDNFYSSPLLTHFNFLHNKKQYYAFISKGEVLLGNVITCNGISYSKLSYFDGYNIMAAIEYPDKMSSTLPRILPRTIDMEANPVIAVFHLNKE